MGHAALFPIRVDGPSGELHHSAHVPFELRLFRRAADCMDDGVVITAQPAEAGEPPVLYVNPAFTTLSRGTLGNAARQSIDTASPSDLVLGDHPLGRSLRESHQSDGVYQTDVVATEQNGCRVVLQVRSEPICSDTGQITHRVAIVRDITQQSALEEVARRNERLACVGLLAAGIAHEINNPTGAALLAAETALALMDNPDAKPQVTACLQNVVTSMDRCGRIVRTLLRYSREEASEKQACGINDVVKEALELARPCAERLGAELRSELDSNVPLVVMNPLEIELVLINLVRNAVEAGGGDVIVSIRTGRSENGVHIVVSDTGCGMSQAELSRVFDPLFTTRRHLGGTGLGMSIAQGIVQGHQGRMEVQSQPGMGTTVTIDLPVAPGSLQANDQGGEERSWPRY